MFEYRILEKEILRVLADKKYRSGHLETLNPKLLHLKQIPNPNQKKTRPPKGGTTSLVPPFLSSKKYCLKFPCFLCFSWLKKILFWGFLPCREPASPISFGNDLEPLLYGRYFLRKLCGAPLRFKVWLKIIALRRKFYFSFFGFFATSRHD